MLNTNYLEDQRKKRRLSKGKYSQLIGLKQSNYSMLLKYKTTSLATIDQIAKALKCSAKRLIGD
jgi:DNA-binding Xre family transcriptional regulator